MAKDNKKCILCHKTYKYCGHCKSSSAYEPSWREAWDTENCMNIFQILSDYLHGKVEAKDAKKKLVKLDLSDKESYSTKMGNAVDEILAVEIIEESKPDEVDKVIDSPVETSVPKRSMKKTYRRN